VVTVRRGDTFSGLVLDWTGSLAATGDVRALNEELDPERLPEGAELWLPWVDDEELIAAHDARIDAPAPAAGPGSPASAPPVAASPGGTAAPADAVHVVQRGESLWKIAEARVGARDAMAYIARIAERNGITDTDRIRAGQKLFLPPPAR
jgi:hypothetical protein